MATSSRRWLTIREVAVVVAILVLITFLLIPAVRKSMPDGPLGEPIPERPPDEENRYHHPSGISIILPDNWVQSDRLASASAPLWIGARVVPGRRSTAIITMYLTGQDTPKGLSSFQPGRFQGLEAYERMVVERKGTFDDPPRSRYELYFRREAGWYYLTYLVARECDELPPMVRRYIETLKWDNTEE